MKRGQIINLGRHRLMCGDSTDINDVNALMNGKKADMVFTDPPFNVGYEGRAIKRKGIINDKMTDSEFAEFLKNVFKNTAEAVKIGGMVYVVMSMKEWHNLTSALRNSGFHYNNCIIWEKDSFVVSWVDYHGQYEPIWYGWKKGGKRLHPLTDRTQSNIWKIKRPKVSKLHPTMKPIELCERAIKNSSNENDIILDIFGGSGSTLIASENTNRICYMMELDEDYCDVIVKRYNEEIKQV